jgi:hypothetical protein
MHGAPKQPQTEGYLVSKWFAAHIIMYVEFKTERQTTYPVWENIVLVHAAGEDEAFAKAEKKGRESEGDDGGTFQWDNTPARWVFGGVRKLTLCQDSEVRPKDGTEITYLQLRVRSKISLAKLIHSERVSVELIEPFSQEEEPCREENGDVRNILGKS